MKDKHSKDHLGISVHENDKTLLLKESSKID